LYKNDPEYLAPITIAEVVRPMLELPPHERSMAEVSSRHVADILIDNIVDTFVAYPTPPKDR
jgi:hypothetical protein